MGEDWHGRGGNVEMHGRRNRKVGWLFLGALGCGTSTSGPVTPAPADTASDVSAVPGFGEPCIGGACASGLTCQDSEYAPFPWCTRLCPTAKEPCDKALLGGRSGLCIQMPGGWRGPEAPFCAPTCGNVSQCTPLAAGWETCALPGYKKKPFYGDVGKVCQAPSANGQIHVDPVTCEWQTLVTDPGVQDLKGLCAAFCTFLGACQIKAKDQSSNCCSWQCFQYLAPGGVSDLSRKNATKCILNAFDGNANGPNVCTAYIGECGPLCKGAADCDDGDGCSTDTCRDWRCGHAAIDGCH